MLLTHQIEKREEITPERYQEMLEVLPPALMVDNGFLVGEPMDHESRNGEPRFQMFMEENGHYYYVGRATKKEFRTMLKPESDVLMEADTYQ